MNNTHRIHVYGSLRVGEYNYERFKLHFGDEMRYKNSSTIEGFALYATPGGAYPYVVHTKEKEDVLEIDTLECTDEVQKVMDQMEHGAGYHSVKYLDGTIYCYYKTDLPKSAVKIGPSWPIYRKEQQNVNND